MGVLTMAGDPNAVPLSTFPWPASNSENRAVYHICMNVLSILQTEKKLIQIRRPRQSIAEVGNSLMS